MLADSKGFKLNSILLEELFAEGPHVKVGYSGGSVLFDDLLDGYAAQLWKTLLFVNRKLSQPVA